MTKILEFGNPYITEQFVLKATEVFIQLNLDADPDNSFNLNFLSDREKKRSVGPSGSATKLYVSLARFTKSYQPFLLTFDVEIIREIISPEEHNGFISQTQAAQENLCLLTMTQLESISVLYRPIVFLTGLPSHRPQNLTPESRNIILHAIKQVSEATIKSGVLFKFAFGMTNGENRNLVPKTDVHLFDLFYTVYPAFESFVCAWFFACRMHPDWLPLVPAGQRNTPALRARLRFLLDSYSDRPVYQTTVPLRKTMYAMLEEMEQVARTGKRRPFNSNLEVGWEKELVELPKEYPFLNGNREGEDLKEPCCYLGLLGLDVGGKLLWKGRSEESWTLFWKNDGVNSWDSFQYIMRMVS
ncbi:hypothetical protein BCR33DRAFT_786736 [Rhizoclosmatium globosum]|uniref:Uncharacterized protein n=1 Tax=Rhizoclosmatium globosum TaxID=329046 RepID=A0A1Y2C4S5_9FUNG|nr:hypothetical protein BCR33DRAFT_786736 [Rhizoclosmatium globosum]|eukprot:ORY42028.1 hypothetical protein BCR33DRAFT_786736 [Rhizoclosmatium globosum]